MTRRNPFQGLVDLSGEMDQMRRLGKTGYDERYERHQRTYADAWAPATDIFRRGTDLFICLELAGLSRDDVEVTFARGALTVHGERSAPGDLADDAFWQRERPFGAFRRTIGLPEHVSEQDITANSRDGLLTITVVGGVGEGAAAARRIPISEDRSSGPGSGGPGSGGPGSGGTR